AEHLHGREHACADRQRSLLPERRRPVDADQEEPGAAGSAVFQAELICRRDSCPGRVTAQPKREPGPRRETALRRGAVRYDEAGTCCSGSRVSLRSPGTRGLIAYNVIV